MDVSFPAVTGHELSRPFPCRIDRGKRVSSIPQETMVVAEAH
jgi:hypothetical protein